MKTVEQAIKFCRSMSGFNTNKKIKKKIWT